MEEPWHVCQGPFFCSPPLASTAAAAAGGGGGGCYEDGDSVVLVVNEPASLQFAVPSSSVRYVHIGYPELPTGFAYRPPTTVPPVRPLPLVLPPGLQPLPTWM